MMILQSILPYAKSRGHLMRCLTYHQVVHIVSSFVMTNSWPDIDWFLTKQGRFCRGLEIPRMLMMPFSEKDGSSFSTTFHPEKGRVGYPGSLLIIFIALMTWWV